jgi:glycosyltransferase involved in cell wall biosynthesis
MPENSRSLRVLQVLEPSGGGSGRHFIDLCRGLIERGHQVVAVYSPSRAEPRFVEELQSLRLDGLHAIDMKRAPHPSDLAALAALRRVIRSAGPFDVIHGHSSKAGFLVRLRLPGLTHVPRLYTPHAFRTMDPTLGTAGKLIFGGVEAMLGRLFSDKVICVSPEEQDHAARTLRIPAPLLTTIVNGVHTPGSGQRDTLRVRLGFRPEDFVFGFVGRLSAQKAPERLVGAFARIGSEFPAARLLMIGFGELEPEVRLLADRLDVSARMVLTSEIPGPLAMQAMDAFVMPSRYEAMSYAMLEAAAAAKPMILTEVGGATTVLDEGVNGRLVANEDDTSALSAAMLEFHDPQRAAIYRAGAQRRASLYSLDTMVDQTIATYRNVMLR